MLAALACAPLQRVPLDLSPEGVRVYVDGVRVERPPPAGLELRADRPHVLFFKKEGHRPQQVVLRAVDLAGGQHRLEPERVAIQLVPLVPRGLDLEVELEDQPPPDH